jgi:uncharacterized membrane protein (UPF0127 family)
MPPILIGSDPTGRAASATSTIPCWRSWHCSTVASAAFYLDLHAHHGDGVEAAFPDEARFFCAYEPTVAIEQRALGRRQRRPSGGAAASRAERRRLQSVVGGSLLVGPLGGAERVRPDGTLDRAGAPDRRRAHRSRTLALNMGTTGEGQRLMGTFRTTLRRAAIALLLWHTTPVAAQQPTGDLTIETAKGARYRFTVEIADTPDEQALGLMFRTEMPGDAGMLFLFESAAVRTFWMQNTLIPLDMIFIGEDDRIVSIVKRAEPRTQTPRQSEGPADAVLEVNGGLTDLLGIAPGDRVVSPLLDR